MNTRTPTPARPALELSATAHYVSPTGRWCRWVPPGDGAAQRQSANSHLFLYHGPRGKPAPNRPASDGFFLTTANLHIVRRIDG
jgi:hypothetical protein